MEAPIAMCSVFDDAFLTNFCLPLGCSIADMLLVDTVLSNIASNRVPECSEQCSEHIDTDTDKWNSIRLPPPLQATSTSTPTSELDQPDSPDITRYNDMEHQDILQLCSQRRESLFSSNEKLMENALKDKRNDLEFYELSPIMKLDNTIFGNDQQCMLSSQFDQFGSPNWFDDQDQEEKQNSKKQHPHSTCKLRARTAESPNDHHNSDSLNNCDSSYNCDIENKNKNKNKSACKPLPFDNNQDGDISCTLNKFTKLSIHGNKTGYGDRGKVSGKTFDNNIKFEESNCIQEKKVRRKKTQMKQTTVTFFYDSDEELKECSEEYENSNSNDNHQPSTYAIRNALRLKKKKNAIFDDKNRGSEDGSSSSDFIHKHPDKIISRKERELYHWLSMGKGSGPFDGIVLCCKETRKSALRTILQSYLSPSLNEAKYNLKKSVSNTIRNTSDSGVNKCNKSDKSNNNKIPSEGLLIVTMKNKIEEWADMIRSMPEPSLYMYTNALASRRKVGAYNLAQYDVVITTFDILRAKEVCIPEEHSSDEEYSECSSVLSERSEKENEKEKEIKLTSINDIDISEARTVSTVRTSRNSTVENIKNVGSINPRLRQSENSKNKNNSENGKNKNNSVPWMKRRNGGVLQVMSNTHLINWKNIILDFHDVTNIRTDTARGVAARSLCGGIRLGLVLTDQERAVGVRGKENKDGRENGNGNEKERKKGEENGSLRELRGVGGGGLRRGGRDRDIDSGSNSNSNDEDRRRVECGENEDDSKNENGSNGDIIIEEFDLDYAHKTINEKKVRKKNKSSNKNSNKLYSLSDSHNSNCSSSCGSVSGSEGGVGSVSGSDVENSSSDLDSLFSHCTIKQDKDNYEKDNRNYKELDKKKTTRSVKKFDTENERRDNNLPGKFLENARNVLRIPSDRREKDIVFNFR